MAEELCAGRDCDKVKFLKLVKFWLKALSILFESSQVLAALAGIVRILQNKVIFFAEHCAGRDCYCKIFKSSQDAGVVLIGGPCLRNFDAQRRGFGS